MSRLKTLLMVSILITGIAQASPGTEAPRVSELATSTANEPGYCLYLRDAPVNALDETVLTLPAFGNDSGFLSTEGLFRYAYYRKTGKWLSPEEARQALADPFDEGNW